MSEISILNYAIISLITWINFAAGYLLGKSSAATETHYLKDAKKFISKNNPLKKNEFGPVKRPTNSDIIKRDAPWIKEEEEEMERALDESNK